jgi:hypothetical protein
MTQEDFTRALILSSRLYPLLSIKPLEPLITYILSRICAARTVRLVRRLQYFESIK